MKQPAKSKGAADAHEQFKQWLLKIPAHVQTESPLKIVAEVELHATTWIELMNIAQKREWSLENAIYNVLSHGVDRFEMDDARDKADLQNSDGGFDAGGFPERN